MGNGRIRSSVPPRGDRVENIIKYTHTHKRFRSISDQFIEFSVESRNSMYQGGRRMKQKGSLGSVSRWSRKEIKYVLA